MRNMRKKLLIVTDFAYPIGGGTERHVFHLAKYFSKKCDVTMLAPSWGENPSELNIEGIKIKKFFSRGKDRIFKNLFYSLKLNPDIIWSHYVLPSISTLPLKFFGKKIIAMLHDFENVRAPYTYFLNLCDKIIVHTNLLREKAIEQGIATNKIVVIPGVIDDVFAPRKLKKNTT
jgi:glycosyltransferase involved in cell wall biosynthesis